MREKLSKNKKEKVAVAFISGSAGELDWMMPILDFLQNKQFKIKIIFLTRHSFKSVKQNKMCNDFISKKNSNLEVVLCGEPFFEKIERISYLSFRLFLKLNLNNFLLIRNLYFIYDQLFKYLFMKKIPKDLLNLKDEKYLFFSEFPSLRRPRDLWIKETFKKSLFFYCPHSPHIYAEDLDKKYLEPDLVDTRKKNFLLMGHPGDFFILNDEKELANPNLEKVFMGHPKYSNKWLSILQNKAKKFHSSLPIRKKINILVISRGYGSYLDEISHNNLVETTIKTIHESIPNYNLFVKKHPREIFSHWDFILKDYPSIQIVNDHILELAANVDFVVSFWGSGAMDCFSLGTPVIEYWDPNKYSKGQVFEKDSYNTIYRKLGIVLAANSQKELKTRISELVSNNFKLTSYESHPFFEDLVDRSNKWDKTMEKIFLSHNII